MIEKQIDEKLNSLLAEIDRLSMRVKMLENVEKIVLDGELNDASTNGVQNGVVTTAINFCAKKDASNLTSENAQSFKDILGFKHVETIYDKSSPNSDLNWGYTGGILGGEIVTKTTGFFEDFVGLYICASCDDVELKFFLDLSNLNIETNSFNGATCGLSGSLDSIMCVKAEVDETKSQFKCTTMGYYSNSYSSQNGVSGFNIHRIEGVK